MIEPLKNPTLLYSNNPDVRKLTGKINEIVEQLNALEKEKEREDVLRRAGMR